MTQTAVRNTPRTGARTMNESNLWTRFRSHYCRCDKLGLRLDISRMGFDASFLEKMSAPMAEAFEEMQELEGGAIANADESRMVGHYWLRAPQLSPDAEIRKAIESTLADILAFTAQVHKGSISAPDNVRFTDLLSIGIGGSALGPRFVHDALGNQQDKLHSHFLDNTDPDGIDRVLAQIGNRLKSTLVIVTSKSGGTAETRNCMIEVRHAFEQAGLSFAPSAVAITQEGSALDRLANSQGWLKRFPMWDWVGGRTSELSAVGLLPAALAGYDTKAMLDGAAACDEVTRGRDVFTNPAALLAMMWHHAGEGHGAKDMVVLPYRDRLALVSQYLQQLVMESLGKRLNRDGREVCQGIAVYGNKGSTDQHAYVQQLRDGLNNFFVTFIEVLADRTGPSIDVDEAGATAGDYLQGFLLGTRQALHEAGRESVTITLNDVSARSIGVLIALFERAVGLYASLVNVNAYHQPGVEAGKKAATSVIDLRRDLVSAMQDAPGSLKTCDEWATVAHGDAELVFHILERLAYNDQCKVKRDDASDPFSAQFGM